MPYKPVLKIVTWLKDAIILHVESKAFTSFLYQSRSDYPKFVIQ
jgi:hypothetical protein